MRKLFLILLFLFSMNALKAELADSCFYVQVDLANRWIWRGASYSESPVIQPSFGYANNKLNVMLWGSYPFAPKGYKEIDFTAEYQACDFLKIGFTDYFAINDSSRQGFFDFNRRTTMHLFDIYTVVNPFRKVPLSFMLSNWFWGADRNAETLKQNFSTYLEARYDLELGNYVASGFAGMTFFEGFYASEAAVVNLGAGLSHDIQINDRFSLPAKIEFVLNPYAGNVFINAIVTIK